MATEEFHEYDVGTGGQNNAGQDGGKPPPGAAGHMKDGRVTSAPPLLEPTPFEPATVELAKLMLATRRRRDRTFPPGLFAEPAWDMLLDLLVAEAEQRRLTVSSACIAAAVPQTTALRWLNYLVESGLVQRVQHAGDSRSTSVRLTPKARRLMSRTLSRTPEPL